MNSYQQPGWAEQVARIFSPRISAPATRGLKVCATPPPHLAQAKR